MSRLNEALKRYVSDTYGYIRRIQSFASKSQAWVEARDAELATMNRLLQESGENDRGRGLQELSAALDRTRSGLRLMEDFVDALEKLAVTSLQVFEAGAEEDVQFAAVCCIIQLAQYLSPRLITFKQDNQDFFQPKLENLEVLQIQLERYRYDVESLCQMWQDESLYPSQFLYVKIKDIVINFDQINLLEKIRMDADFRMVYLFQGREKNFTSKFSMCHSKMCECLKELEACAERLDSMNRSANISGLATSAAGLGGGAMSLAGLVLAPFTFGISLALTAVGTAVAVGSGVASLATDATEAGVHEAETKKAEGKFSEFMEATNSIKDYLETVIEQHFQELDRDIFQESKDLVNRTRKVCKRMKKAAKHIKRFRAFKAGKLTGAGMKVASRASRFLGAAGAVFSMGLDISSIVEHSNNLQNGCETPISKWIRARVALGRCEVHAWHKMCASVKKGELVSSKYKALLN